jgi:hypothetical protein
MTGGTKRLCTKGLQLIGLGATGCSPVTATPIYHQPVNRRLVGSQSLAVRLEEYKNLSPTGIQTLDRLSPSLVAVPPEILRPLL